MPVRSFMLALFIAAALAHARAARAQDPRAQDPRAWQHGLDIVETAPGRYFAIWASSGLPPRGPRPDGEWTHDIYFSPLEPASPGLRPRLLIRAPRAQEPASAAALPDGRVLVTMEDAWRATNVLMQSHAIFDRNMAPLRPYQQVVMDGGHSGHAGATDRLFGVAFSEGWVDGGGVDDLGTGDDVWFAVLAGDGRALARIPVAVGPASRDGWPLVAGSRSRFALLWQRFVPGREHGELVLRIYDPGLKRWVTPEKVLHRKLRYYTQNIQYLREPDAFVVTGTDTSGRGFAMLLATDGALLTALRGLPGFVREAQPAIGSTRAGSVVTLWYPTGRGQLTRLEVTRDRIHMGGTRDTAMRWGTSGTDGFVTADGGLFFLTLSPGGVRSLRLPPE